MDSTPPFILHGTPMKPGKLGLYDLVQNHLNWLSYILICYFDKYDINLLCIWKFYLLNV